MSIIIIIIIIYNKIFFSYILQWRIVCLLLQPLPVHPLVSRLYNVEIDYKFPHTVIVTAEC